MLLNQRREQSSLQKGTKRKLEPPRDPNEIYKHAKASTNGEAGRKRHALVGEELDDDVAGPEPPPADDADGGQDDEEGRFFGGGITDKTAEILDFMDKQEADDAAPERIDAAWLRRSALNFERRITTNAELRAKFESEPQKFMASEADLDAEIKALSILSEHAELYEELVKLGCANSLVSLLSHENTDIAIDAIQIISELTDEDVEAKEEQWDVLVNALLRADVLNLLVQNFSRLDEGNESDRNGVYHSLSVLENLASKSGVPEKIGTGTAVLPWLVKRMQQRESPVSQNKQYSAEVLEILLQSSLANRCRLVELDASDTLLQLLSAYRKRDPEKDSYEEEYVENLFGCLICAVRELEGKGKFVAAEGVELCLIMLREGKMSKPRALRLLDHALQGPGSNVVSESLVEAAGLKIIFRMLMTKQNSQTVEHLLGILSALLQSLPAESAGRIRTLAKFVENEYEKTRRITELRREYASKLSKVDEDVRDQRARMNGDVDDEMETDWLSKRLEAGLFSIQTIDLILAFLAAEDDGTRSIITSLLAEQGESLATVKSTLQERIRSIESVEDESNGVKEMISMLIDCL